jgi:ketosteroid isomerase-like protein
MTGQSIPETIDRFWSARLAGDKPDVLSFMSPGATYEMVGATALVDDIVVGPTDVETAAAALLGDFTFKNLEMLSVIVDGRKAAVDCKIQLSFRGGPFADTEFCDLWEFDDAGKVTSLKQFVDSDFLRKMIAAQAKDT